MTATADLLTTFARSVAERLHRAGLLPGTGAEVMREVRLAIADHVAALRPDVVYLATPTAVHALPWRVEEDHRRTTRRIYDGDGRWIGDMPDPATAELIVSAVNAHISEEKRR